MTSAPPASCSKRTPRRSSARRCRWTCSTASRATPSTCIARDGWSAWSPTVAISTSRCGWTSRCSRKRPCCRKAARAEPGSRTMSMVERRVVVPLGRLEEKRGAERFEMEVPVSVDGAGAGVTRDVSVSGMSFTSREAYAEGQRLEITVDYLLDGHNYPLRCEAIVVRCEAEGGGYAIGVRLATAFLD